jgi:hypothetical protein
LKNNCVKINNVPFFRFWDDDYTDLQNVDPLLKNAYVQTKNLAESLPWICISDSPRAVGFSGPLPMTIDETIQLLETYK